MVQEPKKICKYKRSADKTANILTVYMKFYDILEKMHHFVSDETFSAAFAAIYSSSLGPLKARISLISGTKKPWSDR